MLKKILITVCIYLILGCGANPSELLKTAQFEEKQNNKSHAIELYEEIVTKYPDSNEAKVARQRLAELKK